MALNINGTTGISGVDGSASAPAVTGTDSNTGINFGSDFLAFNTGGTERARFADSGNFGINRTTPSYPLVARRTDASGIVAEFANSSGYGLMIGQNSASGEAYLRSGTGQPLAFVTNGGSGLANERMRIDSSGRVGIGTATTNNPDVGDGGLQIRPNHSGGAPDVHFTRASSSGTSNVVGFVNGNVGVGSIAYNGSATAFNTSSDYRLKENINAISDGITRLKTLKPSRFNFIHDETNTLCDGFIAHEVSPIVPEAITGEKDAVDSDNNPVYQGIDQSKLVPLLTAALQEAIAKIEVLETKVAALEAG